MKDNTNTLKDAGLKVTHPRSKILELLQSNPNDHLSADDIHAHLAKDNESIGLATVYRVLTQLELAGLIQKNQFSDNQSSYEIQKQHHDHLICTQCGKENTRKHALKSHIETHLVGFGFQHKCPFCGLSKSTTTALKHHKKWCYHKSKSVVPLSEN